MASSLLYTSCVCFFFFAAAVNGQDSFDLGEEKKTHLHFFFHDLVSGPNATAIPIVRSPTMNSTAGNFGLVALFDNALTEGPNRSSKLVGRAQGLYATASQQDLALLMTMNFYFTDGVFRGSSLAVLARNAVAEETRELSVVGGTGYFRFAQGYAVARTSSWNTTTGDAVVEYDVYVVHRGPAEGTAPGPGAAAASPAMSAASHSAVFRPAVLLLGAYLSMVLLGL